MGSKFRRVGDRLVFRHAGGWIYLVGFAALPPVTLLLTRLLIPTGRPQEWDDLQIGMAIVCGLLVGAGVILALRRSGTVIDKETGMVAWWWGVLLPFWRKHAPLDSFDAVALRKEQRFTGQGMSPVYVTYIEGAYGLRVHLATTFDVWKARGTARAVAAFVNLRFLDELLNKTTEPKPTAQSEP